MDTLKEECNISDQDLREALKEMGAYVDVTEDDLKRIYSIALSHARERLAQKIPVKDVMTKRVVTAKRNSDIHEISALFSENRISGLPVVDEGNHVIGIVTEADILSMAGMEKEQHLQGYPETYPRGALAEAKARRDRRGDHVFSDHNDK